jgi:hypothetical protein
MTISRRFKPGSKRPDHGAQIGVGRHADDDASQAAASAGRLVECGYLQFLPRAPPPFGVSVPNARQQSRAE